MTDTAHHLPVILYVDDEEQSLKYFQRIFADRFEVLVSTSAAEGRRRLQERAADLAILVTDQRMPGGSGTELLRYARTDHPRIMRILTTAYAELGHAIEAVNSGAIYAYLTKPWDIDQVRTMVQHAYDYFVLQRERDLLLGEKLGVFHRLLLVDRLRHLGALAAALAGAVRRPLAAARNLWEQGRSALPAASPIADDLWGLAIREAEALAGAAARLAADLRAAVATGGGSVVAAALCPGLSVAPATPAVTARNGLLVAGLAGLARPFPERRVAAAGTDGIELVLAGATDPAAVFPLHAGDLAGDLSSLLGWFAVPDHGGSIVAGDGGGRLTIRLPVTATAGRDDEAPTWIGREMRDFE
jgi:two-component system probable response regulator PhcQ